MKASGARTIKAIFRKLVGILDFLGFVAGLGRDQLVLPAAQVALGQDGGDLGDHLVERVGNGGAGRHPQRAPLSRPRPLSGDRPDPCGSTYTDYLPGRVRKCRLAMVRGKWLSNNAKRKMENLRIRRRNHGVGVHNAHGCTRHAKWILRTGECGLMCGES